MEKCFVGELVRENERLKMENERLKEEIARLESDNSEAEYIEWLECELSFYRRVVGKAEVRDDCLKYWRRRLAEEKARKPRMSLAYNVGLISYNEYRDFLGDIAMIAKMVERMQNSED